MSDGCTRDAQGRPTYPFDHHTSAFAADPWSTYQELREGHPERDASIVKIGGLRGRMRDELESRRRSPREDLLGALVKAEAAGTIDAQEAEDLAVMVLIGGVDTTMASLSTAFLRLHRDHATRQRLIDDPSLIPAATEEFLRIDPPVQGFARSVMADTVVGGQPMAAGDTLFMLWGSANRDPDAFPDLKRLPDFSIDEAAVEQPDTIGIVNGIVREPATFTPGARFGTRAGAGTAAGAP